MTLQSLLRDYAVYNHWANQRIIDWISDQPLELMDRQTPSSFPTLRMTFLHIWDAQYLWYERLLGVSPDSFPSKQYDGLIQDVFEGVLRSSEKLAQFLVQQSDDFIAGNVVYKTTSGKEFTHMASEIILTVLQHSTYHRGQIVTMGRSLGIANPPQTDYIAYVRLQSDPVN